MTPKILSSRHPVGQPDRMTRSYRVTLPQTAESVTAEVLGKVLLPRPHTLRAPDALRARGAGSYTTSRARLNLDCMLMVSQCKAREEDAASVHGCTGTR